MKAVTFGGMKNMQVNAGPGSNDSEKRRDYRQGHLDRHMRFRSSYIPGGDSSATRIRGWT